MTLLPQSLLANLILNRISGEPGATLPPRLLNDSVAPVPIGKVFGVCSVTPSPVECKLLFVVDTAVLLFVVIASVAPRREHARAATEFPADVVTPFLVVLLEAESLDLLDP